MAARRKKPAKKTTRRKSAPKSRRRKPPTDGWWGDGPSPWERWPGVSLELPAKWSAARGRWESPCGVYYFDEEAARRPGEFFELFLVHSKGEWNGKPFELLPWQRDLIFRPAFGWLRVADGLRRFRYIFVIVAKKNGKSALASGLALYLLCADGEAGAEVYSAAANEDQARIVFGESVNMVDASRDLTEAAGLIVHKKAITHPSSRSTYRVLSKSVGTKHGFNVHGLIFDEFHTQPTRELWDVLYKGTSARRQPMSCVITTAGSDRESICYEQYEHAHAVLDGSHDDPTLLPVVFETSPDDDWTDEDVWHKANPSLGVTKRLDYMRAECLAATQEPRKRNSFLNLDLNVWTESRVVWIAPERFEVLARDEREPENLTGLVCAAGVDLSSRVDMTSVVLAFREVDGGPVDEIEVDGARDGEEPVVVAVDYRVHLLSHFWIPRDRMAERIRRDRVPYDVWVREGWVTATPGAIVHYGAIYQHILDLMDRYKPVGVGFDPWGAADLAQRLMDASAPMVEVRQGYGSLSAPSKLFEALVLSRRLTYSGSPVMRWCVANCEITSDPAGNIKPVKPNPKGSRRIDGVSAAVIALARLMVAEEPRESGGLSWITF